VLRFKWRAAALAAALTLVTFGLVPSAQGMAPATPDANIQAKKPVSSVSKEVKPQTAAVPAQSKGRTQLLPTDANGVPQTGGMTAQAGNVAALDFMTPYMGCYQNVVQTGIKNNTASVQYYQIYFYANGLSSTMYGSVSASSYSYPTFYGVNGSWSAYMYVWNGSYYQYDEYKSNSLSCNVSIAFSNWGYGYAQLAIKNNGTAQASVNSKELAPYGYAGTYTGSQWDYPVPGGATLYRYFYVGTGLKYGVYSDVLGSPLYTWSWYGTF
jgi:hypothetical protein